jgi:hypothetical protein
MYLKSKYFFIKIIMSIIFLIPALICGGGGGEGRSVEKRMK